MRPGTDGRFRLSWLARCLVPVLRAERASAAAPIVGVIIDPAALGRSVPTYHEVALEPPMDFESITADIRSAEDTSRNNMARIAQSRAILKRAGETLERIRRRHFPAGDSNPLPQRHTT